MGWRAKDMPATYKSWLNVNRMCKYPSHPHYPGYGGLGIKLCFKHWTDLEKELGPRPEGMCLGRLDNTKDFKPGNVKWYSRKDVSGKRTNSLLSKELLKTIQTGVQEYNWDGPVIETRYNLSRRYANRLVKRYRT